MKFIISKDKLRDLKHKLVKYKMSYLDFYVNSGTVRKFDSFIVIEDPSADEFDEPHMEYDSYDGRLYVDKEIRSTFTAMFGDNRKESDDIFKRWFEDRFGVDVAFLA